MNLSELIDVHRGGRSYADLARDCGGSPSGERIRQMLRGPLKNFPDPPTVRALARGLRVSESAVILAAGESLGLDVRTAAPRLVELLPAGTDDLTEEQTAAIAHLVRTILNDPRRISPEPEIAEGQAIEPKVLDVLRVRAERVGVTLEDYLADAEVRARVDAAVDAERAASSPATIGEDPVILELKSGDAKFDLAWSDQVKVYLSHAASEHFPPDVADLFGRALKKELDVSHSIREVVQNSMDAVQVEDPAWMEQQIAMLESSFAAPEMTLAARSGRSAGRAAKVEADAAGEESQDNGGEDPA